MGHPRGQPQGHKNPQVRLHPPLPELANPDKVFSYHKLLCTYPQEQLGDGGITCTYV